MRNRLPHPKPNSGKARKEACRQLKWYKYAWVVQDGAQFWIEATNAEDCAPRHFLHALSAHERAKRCGA